MEIVLLLVKPLIILFIACSTVISFSKNPIGIDIFFPVVGKGNLILPTKYLEAPLLTKVSPDLFATEYLPSFFNLLILGYVSAKKFEVFFKMLDWVKDKKVMQITSFLPI